MTSYRILAVVCALVVPVAGCAQKNTIDPQTSALAQRIEDQPQLLPGVPKGFECPLIPNGFDPAGSIYRLDQAGTYYRVKDYGSDPAITAMRGYRKDVKVANYVFSDAQKSSAGVSLAVLKTALPGLTASANADFKKNLNVDITVSDMMAESIDDEVADHILERFQKEARLKPGSKYFLVRETVRAGVIGYSLKRDDVAKLGGEAQMAKLANGQGNVTFRDNGGLFEIKQDFPGRVAVCIKPSEIVLDKTPGAASGELALKAPGDTTMPPITKIGVEQTATAKPATAPAPAAQPPAPAQAQPTATTTTAAAPVTVVPPVSTATGSAAAQ